MAEQPAPLIGAEEPSDQTSPVGLTRVEDPNRSEEAPAEYVEWVDVEAGVRRLVHVWLEEGDIAWMKEAWSRLTARGWTEYDGSGLGRTRVLVRALALGHLYWDFTYLAFDLGTDMVAQMDDALEELGLAPLFVGQLAGPEIFAEGSDGIPSVAMACWELSVVERQELIQVLLAAFEGEADLFVSLWRSARCSGEEGQDDDYEILSENLTVDKLKGYEWIVDGCPVIHDQGGW